ncbi:GAF domain-containing protein [Thermocoleostomius sinensis]|uniref:histidine kinase n=1 Tax=Thermocoleostomius sinensis A174 TaxID=2016057 RepID=A0A9E8ZGQ6_9CYAN|nr:GAF domain-containing protein [Thermocoleostomius sinensis]WAL60885.1 GAF domain-containing protein [Thermocoleostomius sinensis A174]
MNLNHWEQLRNCCRDEMAFAQLQQLLSIAQKSPALERHYALLRIINKFQESQESLDLATIFDTTVTEVRQLLCADRACIFRFAANSNWTQGEFISEDVIPAFHSALEIQVYDRCFGTQHAMHYQAGHIQAVTDIYQAGFQDCHLQILRRFQIRANLVVPLLQRSRLWGLLCVHQCAAPRNWQPDEIEFVAQIAKHLGIALQQVELLETTQQQAIELSQTIDQLKENQVHLVHTEKMSNLRQLVASVVHEINNPANFIYGNLSHVRQYAENLLELLARYRQEHANPSQALVNRLSELDFDFLAEDFPKILTSMQLGVDRIRQVILSLCHFSETNESRMRLVNIHDSLESVLLILQHRFKSNTKLGRIQLVKDYGELPLVECYANQLSQVFMYLLTYALDALEAQASRNAEAAINHLQIIIRTGIIPDLQTGIDRIIVRIADTGSGMPQPLQSQLIESNSTRLTNQDGELGLAISRQIIVDRHGGSLECYSQPGEGTEFWIELPLRQELPQEVTAGRTMEAWTFD